MHSDTAHHTVQLNYNFIDRSVAYQGISLSQPRGTSMLTQNLPEGSMGSQ